jgi:hypothetical protein
MTKKSNAKKQKNATPQKTIEMPEPVEAAPEPVTPNAAYIISSWIKNHGWKGYRWGRASKDIIEGIAEETGYTPEEVEPVFVALKAMGMQVISLQIGMIQLSLAGVSA